MKSFVVYQHPDVTPAMDEWHRWEVDHLTGERRHAPEPGSSCRKCRQDIYRQDYVGGGEAIVEWRYERTMSPHGGGFDKPIRTTVIVMEPTDFAYSAAAEGGEGRAKDR